MLSIQELRSSTQKELLQELTNAEKQLLQIRMGVKTKHQKDTSLIKKTKATIARIKSLLREMELEEAVKNLDQEIA